MTYTISKMYKFSASHILEGLPDGHQCGRLHGHNYQVELELEDDSLNQVGFVVDFGELKPFSDCIDSTLDHRHLNDVLTGNPTAENIAKYLFEVAQSFWPEVTGVTVYETPTCKAKFARQR